MKKLSSMILAVALALISSMAQAAMTVSKFTGTLTVTLADNSVITYTPGDGKTPSVPDGAKVSVSGGSATLMSGNAEVSLPDGATAKAQSDNKGLPQVVALVGNISVGGKSVKAGQTATTAAVLKLQQKTEDGTLAAVKTDKFVVIITGRPNQDFGVSCQAGVSPSAPC